MKQYRNEKTIFVDETSGEIINIQTEKRKGAIYVQVNQNVTYKEVGNLIFRQIIKIMRKLTTQTSMFN